MAGESGHHKRLSIIRTGMSRSVGGGRSVRYRKGCGEIPEGLR